jgi:heptaprenyl diphosphate synthase
MRIGLANLPLLLALASPKAPAGKTRADSPLLFAPKEYCLLVLLKIFGQALITGTLFSYVFLFSLAGTVTSAACMYFLRRIPGPRFLSLTGTGIAGAFVSNAAQLILARFLIFGESARYLAPPFLAAGIISGGILGLFAEGFAGKSQWVRNRIENQGKTGKHGASESTENGSLRDSVQLVPKKGDILRFYSGLGAAAIYLLIPWLTVRAGLFVLFWIAALILGKRTRPILTLLVIFAVTACNLFPPYGKVLLTLGPLTITLGSLLGGLRKALTLEGLIMLSKVFIPDSGVWLPGPFGRLLGESLAVLEKLNRRKSAGNADAAVDAGVAGNAANAGAAKRGLMEKLDRLLCEL